MINSVAALVPQIVIEIGALAGLASFLGVTTLAILTFVQGRDLRRLRDWAGRAPERDAEFQEATAALAAGRAEEMRNAVEELPHGDPLEAEARAMQLRAARQRNRGEGIGPRLAGSRIAQVLAGVLAVAAVAGVTYFAIGQLGGDDEPAREDSSTRQLFRKKLREGELDDKEIEITVSASPMGVEIMANSDNVLRGGLTSKYVDVPELVKVLDFQSLEDPVVRPNDGQYHVPAAEFSLHCHLLNGSDDSRVPIDHDGPDTMYRLAVRRRASMSR